MTQDGTWVAYGGAARVELAGVLLVGAAGIAYAGTRIGAHARATRPGRAVLTFMLLIWILAIATFLVCLVIYVQQELRDYPGGSAAPPDHILPFTLLAAVATFFAILIASPDRFPTNMLSAVVGAIAAPMIFELPFDLIVMARTYPAVFPHPAVFRALFFVPLFLVEVTTLSLLTACPMVRLSRATFYAFAAMLTVFAVWGSAGFWYPSTPLPFALNLLSKLLAFVTAISLFLPQRARAKSADAELPRAMLPA